MYKVISPEWNDITIKAGFESEKAARRWAKANCGPKSCWDGIWEIQYYNPNPFVMKI